MPLNDCSTPTFTVPPVGAALPATVVAAPAGAAVVAAAVAGGASVDDDVLSLPQLAATAESARAAPMTRSRFRCLFTRGDLMIPVGGWSSRNVGTTRVRPVTVT